MQFEMILIYTERKLSTLTWATLWFSSIEPMSIRAQLETARRANQKKAHVANTEITNHMGRLAVFSLSLSVRYPPLVQVVCSRADTHAMSPAPDYTFLLVFLISM